MKYAVLKNLEIIKPKWFPSTISDNSSNEIHAVESNKIDSTVVGSIITLQDVKKNYQTPAGDFQALKGITVSIDPNEFLCIVGKSGAGKTTLLNMITGVDSISSGKVNVNGISVHDMSEDEQALWRGLNLGIIYQSFELMPMLTLLENVMLPMDFCHLYTPGKSRERARELLRMVELEEHMNKLPNAISGGQQQRVAIARALANDPPVIVADEPTGRLDSTTAETILDIFEHMVKEGKTIIMVTHDASAAQRASRVLEIVDGELKTGDSTNISMKSIVATA
ncbi:ABC transporter ATP-binding protein [Leptolinea tardivitalis]|uniref:ABC transporter ATP-binding protein n=1 Tax=Leptolinea tardivitalis TaxID=229920 RepID=UPI0009D6ADED|nr:ABC transporter ATP-binding protein [Leptolinea tardivitalis]GAP21076.1 ABC-type antimicrobial peptide transport system, ATPase component [Leptolinea tardivitalis]